VWGHRLRRMPLEQFRVSLRQFFSSATSEYRFVHGNVWISDTDPQITSAYEVAAGRVVQFSRIANLEEPESERCLDQLLIDEADFRSRDIHLSVWHEYEVRLWKFRATDQVTTSRLTARYDIYPSLGTELRFESTQQFQCVSGALTQFGLCTLNPKHLKAIRTRGGQSSDA
jgi:hypothetical protein